MVVPATCTLSPASCSLFSPTPFSRRTLCSINCCVFYNCEWLSRKNSSICISGSLVMSPLKAYPFNSQNWYSSIYFIYNLWGWKLCDVVFWVFFLPLCRSCSSALISRWGEWQHRESAVYALSEESNGKDSLSASDQSNTVYFCCHPDYYYYYHYYLSSINYLPSGSTFACCGFLKAERRLAFNQLI